MTPPPNTHTCHTLGRPGQGLVCTCCPPVSSSRAFRARLYSWPISPTCSSFSQSWAFRTSTCMGGGWAHGCGPRVWRAARGRGPFVRRRWRWGGGRPCAHLLPQLQRLLAGLLQPRGGCVQLASCRPCQPASAQGPGRPGARDPRASAGRVLCRPLSARPLRLPRPLPCLRRAPVGGCLQALRLGLRLVQGALGRSCPVVGYLDPAHQFMDHRVGLHAPADRQAWLRPCQRAGRARGAGGAGRPRLPIPPEHCPPGVQQMGAGQRTWCSSWVSIATGPAIS
jgi:hypothetical protein